MKKITLILSLILFLPFVLTAQQCPDPVGDGVQYFCTGSAQTLNDLTVTAPGTLTWYDDAAKTTVLPGNTAIVNGTTYYVSNTEVGCTESDLLPITARLQSTHFNVSPISCINLGNIVYVVDPDDVVTIEARDINGNLITGHWTKVGVSPNFGPPLYIDSNLLNAHFNWPFDTVYFGNAAPNEVYTFSFTPNVAGGACPNTAQQFTIYTGAYIYDDLCYGATTTLDGIGVPGDTISWFSDDQGINSIPGTTVIEGDTTYYAGFGDPSCPDLLPVIVEYKVEPPVGSSDQFLFCTAATWLSVGIIESDDKLKDLGICGTNLTWYDSTMTTVLPANTVLVNGTTYYVTQKIGGCES